MKKLLTLIFIFISCFSFAQRIDYSYDAAGNRVQRIYVYPRLKNPALEKDSSDLVEAKYSIKVFPNPTSGNINVSISSLEDGETAKVYLSDDQGKVLSMKVQVEQQEILDMSNLKAGIYYIKVYVKSGSVSYKVVKL